MKHLKLFFALFAMLALGVGNAWGAEVAWDLKSQSYASATDAEVVWSHSDVTARAIQGSGTKVTNYLANSSQTRLYNKNTLSIEPATGCTISSIVITATGNSYVIKGTWGNGTASTSGAVVTVTPTDGTKNVSCAISATCRLTEIKVVYESTGGGSTPIPALNVTPTTIDFGTVEQGATIESKTVSVNFANLTDAVTYSGLSTPFTATGDITNTGDQITIAADASTIGEYSQTLTIASAADSKTAEVTVTMNIVAPFVGKKLVFDFVTHPSGWPAAKANATAGNYVYTLDEVDYTFSHTKSGDGIYLGGTSKTSGYLMLASGNKLGLPAIKGYKLVKVDGTLNGSGSPSTASQVSITNASGTVISGGAAQTWDTKGGTKTYNLTDTEVNTVYYLTVANKNLQMITLALYYEEVAGAADIPDAPTLTASQEFETETFTVEISAVDGATIHYTLDGNDPTEASTTYSAPFTVNATTIVKAIAVKDGVASNVATATYTKVSVIEKTCAEAATLCTSDESTDKYRVEGYVTAIETAYSAQYNNITVWMADTRNGGNVLQAFRATPTVDADKAVKVGDQIEVVGKLKLYNSVPEIVSGTYTITQLDPVYNVNITSAHGTATATPTSAVEGTEITLSVEVESGWVFQSWTVTDASYNPIEVTDNKFTMPASDVNVVANYTESEAPDAVLTLMANGNQHSQVTYKQGETVELPATIANDCVKQFVGWSADDKCAVTPEYAPGADFELTAAEHTLYAVYASEINLGEEEEYTFTSFTQANTVTIDAPESFTITLLKGSASTAPQWNAGSSQARVYAKGSMVISADAPITKIVYTYVENKGGSNNVVPTISGVAGKTNAGEWDASTKTWTGNDKEVTFSTSGTAGNIGFKKVAVTVGGTTLANFSTTCSGALAAPTFSVAEGEYTEEQSITLSAAEGTIYYTLDGNNPTSASDVYSEAIVLDECGEFTIKAIAIGTESESPVASATYTINLPITNTEATAYTPAEAIAIIDGACDKTEEVYVKGVVVSTSGLNTEYGNYDNVVVKAIDDESATPTKFTFFRLFKAAEKTKFTASDEVIGVGDIITAKGKLTKYNSTYELAEGCYLVSRVANVKLDAELAWNPETVTLTVGDAFTAPTLVNTYSVTGITYESSNDAVATVTAEGVIALVDDAVGTATITATFDGDATYKPATVTCTIKVKAIPEDCEGSDDFATDESESPLSYLERTTAAGWKATNAARVTIEDETYFAINGKTSAVGTITSPVLNGGIGSIKIRYANTYSEDNGVSFRLDIKQNDAVVKTYTITKANADVTEDVVYTELIEDINVEGDFVMVFTNLSPTNVDKNKDRVSIGRLCWTGYEIPKYTITTTAENGTISGAGVYGAGATVTLTATPDFDYEFVNWTVGGEVVSTDNPYTFPASANVEVVANFQEVAATTAKSGKFSTGKYEYAEFATGNLQHQPSTNTWRFAKQQYQYVGEANINVGDDNYEGWIDMFGWSNGDANKFGVNPSNKNEDYHGEFVDWGTKMGSEWSTLSKDQWHYLLFRRANYSTLKQIAMVDTIIGIMLFPDDWNLPSGCEPIVKRYTYTEEYPGQWADYEFDYNYYTLAQWADLETEGAVFLPAAGRRTGGVGNKINKDQQTVAEDYRHFNNANFFGYYWTSQMNTNNDKKEAYFVHNIQFMTGSEYAKVGQATYASEQGRYGQSVRLAKVTSTAYTRTVTNGEWGTICLPKASSSVTGATFYEVSSLVVGEGLWLDQLADGNQLEAGKPYIFQATATEIAVTYTGEEVGAPVEGANGLTGTFTEIAAGGLTGNYIIAENKVWVAGTGATLPANRAYIANTVPTTPQAQIPGRRRVCMGENAATGFENVTNGENTTIKVIENGQLIIIRNGEKFNAQGVRF